MAECFNFSLCIFLNRQQVPERNQKKKKKMKWRAERSASSHRFHCAILWPPLVLLFLQCWTDSKSPTYIWIPSKELPAAVNPQSTKMMAAERSEWEESAPSQSLWTMPSLLHYLCCLLRMFNRPYSETTSLNSLYQVSFRTLISNAAQDGWQWEVSVTLIMGAFIFIRKGKGKKMAPCVLGLGFHRSSHFSTHTGATWNSPARRLSETTSCGGIEDEFESERKWNWTGTLMCLCEERAVERERKGYVRWTLWSYRCLDIVIVTKTKTGQCFYT